MMNVLSLFDGQSCGQIALKELDITPDIYYASEIEPIPIAQTQYNFPKTIQLGSVVDVDVSKLEPIDLLIGGSPCQSFSFAGKRAGMSTKCEIEITALEQYLQLKSESFEFEGQSYLFWEYMRILTDIRKYNPDVLFLLENVEMGKKWERVLSEAIGVYGQHINSALFSAQNRKRIYWTNIRTRQEGLFGEFHTDIPLPPDRGILLKDILEDEVDEKYYLSEKSMKLLGDDLIQKSISRDKSMTIDASYYKGVGIRCGDCRQVVEVTNSAIYQRPRGENKGGIFEGKTPTLSANAWEQNNLLVLGNIYNNSQSGRVYSIEGKSATLSSQGGGGGAKTGLYLVNTSDTSERQIKVLGNYSPSGHNASRIVSTDGIAPTCLKKLSDTMQPKSKRTRL